MATLSGIITPTNVLTAQNDGTLATTKGGTGLSSYTDGELLIGNTTGNTLTKATLTAGTGISITNGAGSVTVASTVSGGGDYVMRTFTSPTTWTKPAGLKAVKVTVVGGGGGARSGGGPTPQTPLAFANPGGTSSFGPHVSATGGAGNSTGGPASDGFNSGGSGSGGDINITPAISGFIVGSPTSSNLNIGAATLLGGAQIVKGTNPAAGAPIGGGAFVSKDKFAGAGGGAILYLPAESIPGPVSVTVGAGGTAEGPPLVPAGETGAAGVVIVEEFY